MKHAEAKALAETRLLDRIRELFGLEEAVFELVSPHDGGRNLVYRCLQSEGDTHYLRIAYHGDRTRRDLLAELEFVHYLAAGGAGVADCLNSVNGKLLEELEEDGQLFFACVFEEAPGLAIYEQGYRYRDGAPIEEYFYNWGKTLGKIHRLSKAYVPEHRRYDFFDFYTPAYLDEVLPESLPRLKQRFRDLLARLAAEERNSDNYGLIHFDFNEGNFRINYGNGEITAFDFDNCCYGWYLYDLADSWTQGLGWIRLEADPEKRRAWMDRYFGIVIDGYRSETDVSEGMLAKLPLFIQAVLMENILDDFAVMRAQEREIECDEYLSYLIRCVQEDIPYKGFFHPIYRTEEPFEVEIIEV